MKVKKCVKITETRIHLTDAESNLVAECPEKYADYIVQAINSHEKLYRKGYEDGLRDFAWWKDGIQYVGCGTTLKQALKEAEKK